MNDNILGFKQLPTSLVNAFDEPDDKFVSSQQISESIYIWTCSYKTSEIYTPSSAMVKDRKSLRLKMSLIIYKPNHMIWIILT